MSIRKALGAVKDQTRIGIAKVVASGAELDVAVVRATAHDDAPADGRHAREVLRLTSSPSSRARVAACVASVSRRLARTRDYVVAAKCLALLHRLLADGDPHFRHELAHGCVLGAAAEFRDEAHAASWDHSAFVRAFALYLDARARFLLSLLPPPRTVRFASVSGPSSSSSARPYMARPVHEMDAAALLARARQLRELIGRCLACRPTGAARRSLVVLAALLPVARDSAGLYGDMAAVLAVLLDRFFDMEYEDCAEAFEAHVSAARLADDLLALYSWCDHAGVAISSDLSSFPEVRRVDDKLLETLEQFLRERRQATQTTSPPPPPLQEQQASRINAAAEYGMNGVKALPAPEQYNAVPAAPMGADQEQNDLVDLRESEATAEEQGNKMALALFSGQNTPPATETKGSWVAFPSDDDDAAITTSAWQTPAAVPGKAGWELALVETASTLSRSTAALGGGMDPLLLHGMYDHHGAAAVRQQHAASGSASSVVLPGAAPAGFLALPGPVPGGDPFAASLEVPPPAYVQMAEMERKRELLAQEQRMWAQYRQGGMQGQTGLNGVAVGGGGSAFAASSSMPMAMAAYHGGATVTEAVEAEASSISLCL